MPDDLALRLASLPALSGAPDAVFVAEKSGRPISEAAATLFAVANRFGLGAMREAAQALPVADHYERMAIDRAVAAIGAAERDIAISAARHGSGAACGRGLGLEDAGWRPRRSRAERDRPRRAQPGQARRRRRHARRSRARMTKASRAGIAGWILFDFATQPVFTLITTFIFAPFFAGRVAENPVEGQALWGFATGAAGLAIALLSPVLGAVADAAGRRKPWIFAFSLLLVVGCAALWFAVPGAAYAVPVAMIGFAMATIGAEFATVFTNAMMPGLVPPDKVGRLSGTGWAVGYVGGLISLALMLALIVGSPETGRTLARHRSAVRPRSRDRARATAPRGRSRRCGISSSCCRCSCSRPTRRALRPDRRGGPQRARQRSAKPSRGSAATATCCSISSRTWPMPTASWACSPSAASMRPAFSAGRRSRSAPSASC